MHPELAFGAFLASALVLVPLPWHWRSRNTTTFSMILWLFVSNLTYAINSIIWAGRTDNVVPVWCDIVTKIDIGATAALPACCLSLALQLWRVSSISHTSRKTILMVDLGLCWAFPVIVMALHYIVQGHRFDIIEDIGCRPTTYVSIPAILLLYGPIAIVVALTFIFSALALRAFYIRRRAFTAFLQDRNSPLTPRRYIRVMVITFILATWEATVIGIVYAITFSVPLRPYTSWADVHSGFSLVAQFPSVLMPPNVLMWTYISWWTIPISGFSFFLSFSFGNDAAKEYGPLLRWLKCRPPCSKVQASETPSASLPSASSFPSRKDDFNIGRNLPCTPSRSDSDSWDSVNSTSQYICSSSRFSAPDATLV
ncbi:pheromone A receptor-domain-containing protein [Mycena vitilis]|nr:pheromone A receptor-domain-containing protein [Mycena vitilis]